MASEILHLKGSGKQLHHLPRENAKEIDGITRELFRLGTATGAEHPAPDAQPPVTEQVFKVAARSRPGLLKN
jgi:hypothetical protein